MRVSVFLRFVECNLFLPLLESDVKRSTKTKRYDITCSFGVGIPSFSLVNPNTSDLLSLLFSATRTRFANSS